MPVGLQLIGNYWQEGPLLHAAHALPASHRLARARAGGF
jgi:Asp-tRNA(Asn)/Glu-tRNA(Gln) amidotransferase A subunit family amidase